jgi:hypothetical protein
MLQFLEQVPWDGTYDGTYNSGSGKLTHTLSKNHSNTTVISYQHNTVISYSALKSQTIQLKVTNYSALQTLTIQHYIDNLMFKK